MPKHIKKHTLICVKCGEPFKSARDHARYCPDCRLYPLGDPLYENQNLIKQHRIRKCPFCGSLPELNEYSIKPNVLGFNRYRYECSNNNCIARFLPNREFLSEKEARAAWNGRV